MWLICFRKETWSLKIFCTHWCSRRHGTAKSSTNPWVLLHTDLKRVYVEPGFSCDFWLLSGQNTQLTNQVKYLLSKYNALVNKKLNKVSKPAQRWLFCSFILSHLFLEVGQWVIWVWNITPEAMCLTTWCPAGGTLFGRVWSLYGGALLEEVRFVPSYLLPALCFLAAHVTAFLMPLLLCLPW